MSWPSILALVVGLGAVLVCDEPTRARARARAAMMRFDEADAAAAILIPPVVFLFAWLLLESL